MPAERVARTLRRRTEAGTTLVELLVVMSLLSVIMGIVLAGLVSMQNTENRVNNRSQTNDQVRLAVEQIDKQVRSGNVLYDPALEGANAGSGIAAGFSMRVYTQANGVQRCVQWRVTGATLQARSWSQAWQSDNAVSDWRTVADHVVNTSSNPPFALDPTAGFGSRLVNIDVIANVRSDTGANVEGKTSVTGRNTQYGYDPVVCNVVPPWCDPPPYSAQGRSCPWKQG
jgi:type II secretory pathway component PulJ